MWLRNGLQAASLFFPVFLLLTRGTAGAATDYLPTFLPFFLIAGYYPSSSATAFFMISSCL